MGEEVGEMLWTRSDSLACLTGMDAPDLGHDY